MTYVQLFEDWVLLDPWEHDSHSVGPILQEGDLHSVHVVGQFLDISLQLCKGWEGEGPKIELGPLHYVQRLHGEK